MATNTDSFCFPIRTLENDRIKLVPFDVKEHADKIYQASNENADLFKYLPYGPFSSAEEYVTILYLGRIASSDREFLYTILVKTPRDAEADEQIAGVFGLLNADPAGQAVEIGHAMTLKKFQRTFVTSNAIGLLLKYLLDPPPAGLGLRRVQWQAHASNKPSIHAAERMGFFLEGIIRWQRVLPEGKETSADLTELAKRNGEAQRPGRHTALLSMCWDDWLEKREHVLKLMERR